MKLRILSKYKQTYKLMELLVGLTSHLLRKGGTYRKLVTRPPVTPVSRFFRASTKYPKLTLITVEPETSKTRQGLSYLLPLVRDEIG